MYLSDFLNWQKVNVAKQKYILAEGVLNAREGILVLIDKKELEDTLILW